MLPAGRGNPAGAPRVTTTGPRRPAGPAATWPRKLFHL